MYDRVEVLSCAYEHLYLADWTDAVSDVFVGRAEVVETHESRTIGTVSGDIPLPKVIRFKSGQPMAKYRGRQVTRFNRDVLYIRDEGKCQYCKKVMTKQQVTVDHVLPRSRGGVTTWENCVVCCSECNTKKGSMTPHEAGMNLLKTPAKPSISQYQIVKR